MKEKEVSKSKNNTLQHPTRTTPTFSQRAADRLTIWIGSWPFIITFIIILIAWVLLIVSLPKMPPELDHFLILNLFLSCVAAIQAPIILMSQNRAGQKDRQRMEYDYQVDKKSGKEIEEIKKQLNRIEKRLNERK